MLTDDERLSIARNAAASARHRSPWATRVIAGHRDDDDAVIAALAAMREVERVTVERCAGVALAEKVDAEATGDESDSAYNQACDDIAAAIRAGEGR